MKVFAKGICFKKLFFVFLLGSIIGTFWEEGYLFLKRIIIDAPDTSYRFHRGVLYGPLNPIYGIGALIITYFLGKKKRLFIINLLLAVLIGGIIEFTFHFFQELLFNTTSWDYTNKLLNIDGRTSIIYMLFFGFIGALFLKFIYPYFSSYIEKIPIKIGNIIFYILLIFMIFNITITIIACNRYNERYNNIESNNFVDDFCDKHYPDKYIEKIFVNMKKISK